MADVPHIVGEAAYLASLPEGDAERVSAEAHAAQCDECRQALSEGARLIALLDAESALPEPSGVALARAKGLLTRQMGGASEPVAAEGRARWADIARVATAAGLSFGIALMLAKQRSPSPDAWRAAGGVGAGAALLAALGFFEARLALAATLLVSIAFAVVSGAGGALEPMIGVKCTLVELAVSALPLLIAGLLQRYGRVPHGPLGLASAAAAGALGGHAALHVTCPVASAEPHLLVFHVGGVLLAALLGFRLGRRLKPRSV